MLKIQTEKILQKEMDRKAFLRNTGIAFIGLLGVTTVVKQLNLFGDGNVASRGQHTSVAAYGGSVYGGDSAARRSS